MKHSAVLLHGFTGSTASWRGVLDSLRASGRDVSAPDLPGHGRRAGETDAKDFSLDAALEGVGAALSGVETVNEGVGAPGRRQRPALLGYSMGGRIALHYAYRNPGRLSGLVLESASPGLATADERAERRTTDEVLAQALERGGIEAFVDRWEASPLFATQRGLAAAIREEVRARRLTNRPRALALSLRHLGTGSLPSLWDVLPQIDVPTLVLVGELDGKFREIGERMVGRLPDASLNVVPDAGHTIHLERPNAWIRAVGGFLGGGAEEGNGVRR